MLVFIRDIVGGFKFIFPRSLGPFCQRIYRIEFGGPAERAAPALSQQTNDDSVNITESSLVCTMHMPSTDPRRCVVINVDGCSDAPVPNTTIVYTYRRPSPLTVVVFLKNFADGKTVRKKWG